MDLSIEGMTNIGRTGELSIGMYRRHAMKIRNHEISPEVVKFLFSACLFSGYVCVCVLPMFYQNQMSKREHTCMRKEGRMCGETAFHNIGSYFLISIVCRSHLSVYFEWVF